MRQSYVPETLVLETEFETPDGVVALIEPAFVKLDMSMIRGLHRSHHKASLVRRMVEFANDVGIEVVADLPVGVLVWWLVRSATHDQPTHCGW